MKVNKFLKKTLCLVLALTMVLGNTSPVAAAHEHETAAEIVTEITNATIKEAEKLIDKQGLLDSADVTDTKDALEEADDNLVDSMDSLGTAVEDAEAAIDALDGKVTKDDAKEINASLSVAYNEANRAWEDAVAVSDAAVADIEKAADAYEAASKISDEAAKTAEAELKSAQEALNAAVEATKFANDSMTSLKNEFAKATELASKWNAEAEETLVEATAKFEEAQEALNNALLSLETEDAEFKVAIDEFKRCYDAFIEAANAFKASIETAIEAQDTLDALYAEYEAAQTAYAEALAAYEAKCAEYAEAELLATYESYADALTTLEGELAQLEADLDDAETDETEALALWEAALKGADYLAMKDLTDILAKKPETEEDKAAVEKATYDAAAYIIEKKLANGKKVINVGPEGENEEGIPTYGKADKDYFVVLTSDGKVANRYGYRLNYDENGKGVVNIYEMVATDDVTNYIKYNDSYKELHFVEGNQYYIEVGLGSEVELVKNEDGEYIETLTAEQTFAQNPTEIPTKVNAVGLIEYAIDNVFGFDLPLKQDNSGYYVDLFGIKIPIEVNVDLQKDDEGKYSVVLLKGVEIFGVSCEITLPVEVSEKADGTGYDVNHVYDVDVLYTEEQLSAENATVKCVNGAHGDYGHANEVACDVPLHVRYNNHAAAFDVNCINHETDTECEAAECNSELHKTSGLHGKDNVNAIVGTCTEHKDKKILGIGYDAHKYENGVIYGLTGVSFAGASYEEATCGVQLNGACSTCTAGTVAISCTGGTFGFCNKETRYIATPGSEFPETLAQAVYEGEAYTVQGSLRNGLYIEIPAEVEGEPATRIDLAFVDVETETESDYYTYEVKHESIQGGVEDTVFVPSENPLGTDSNVYAKKVSELENTYNECGDECDRISGLITAKEKEITAFIATYADLVSAYTAMVETEAVATAKDLGELADLPKNISEMVDGMEVEEMLTLLEAIIELSSQNEDVDYEAILEVLKETLDESAAGRLIWVLGYDAVEDGIGSIMPFGLFDDLEGVLGDLEDAIGGVIDSLTPPTEFERAYANAWVDALTTKIKVVQTAIELVEVSVETVETGVTAVTEGIELADVAADAVLATAEKKLLEATVDVLVMANDILNSTEEVVLSIDSVIAEAQARTEAAYLAAVAERNALNQVTFERPYAAKLDDALVAIGSANALNSELSADIAAAEVTLATVKALYEELKVLEEHEHNYESVTTDPTCTREGYTTHTCTVCSYIYTDSEVDATGHSYETTVVDAICTMDGSITDVCNVCGDTKVETIPATGHNYEAVVTAPTCTTIGFTTNTCNNCNDSFVSDEVAALGHSYEAVVTNPTCTEAGYTTHTCSACGSTYKDTEVAATGHVFGEWVETKPATETEYGVKERYCTVTGCEGKEVGTVDKLPHTHIWNEGVVTEPTCTEKGYTTYTCTNETCKYVEVRDLVDALNHNYIATETAPTCTADGYFTHVCSRCNDTYTTEGTKATGHSFGDWTVKTPAAENVQGEETRTCHCGVTETQVIPALGHSYEAVITAPTCTEEGYTTYTCACGDSYVADKVSALGHKENAVVTNPTCTEGGYTTYTCSVCGNVRNADETSALGHDYVPTVTNPTCTAAGYTTYACACGDSYVADEVAALGHSWSEWTVEDEASEFVDGKEVRTCSQCSEKEEKAIEKLGHSYETVVTAPTCTEEGYTTYTCACGHSYVDEESYVDALGHDFGDWTTSKEAVRGELGEEKRECTRCDAFETREVKVLVTEITLDKTTAKVVIGKTLQLTATVGPENVTDETVTWTTSNEEIATVTEDGLVTAVSRGNVEIKAIANDGSEVTAMCVITVTYPAVYEPEDDNTPSTPATDNTTEDVVEDVESVVENEIVEVDEVVIEDDETPLADGSDDEVETDDEVVIEDEKTPLADGEIGNDGGNVGLVVAIVTGVGVVGAGAAVAAAQAGVFDAGVAGTTAGTGIKGLVAAVAAFFKKLFKK